MDNATAPIPVAQEEPKTQRRSFVRLTAEERNFIDKISAISGVEAGTVREIFLAILVGMTLELYSGSNELWIPYIAKLKVSFKKESLGKDLTLKENYDITASPAFHDVVTQIASGNKTWVEGFIKTEIARMIQGILELELEGTPASQPGN